MFTRILGLFCALVFSLTSVVAASSVNAREEFSMSYGYLVSEGGWPQPLNQQDFAKQYYGDRRFLVKDNHFTLYVTINVSEKARGTCHRNNGGCILKATITQEGSGKVLWQSERKELSLGDMLYADKDKNDMRYSFRGKLAGAKFAGAFLDVEMTDILYGEEGSVVFSHRIPLAITLQ